MTNFKIFKNLQRNFMKYIFVEYFECLHYRFAAFLSNFSKEVLKSPVWAVFKGLQYFIKQKSQNPYLM